ncbi:YcaO-like family protein [Halococcus dombrowskii]|uniref:YcaO-like family protein n=1 Tax=Halococcus dombrowskii TaxID=179637 RepID=A0AAV3SDZ5_HALDO|nr:YcaO-like family protein [Halococcus dombrowskii]UOO94029.1 YcaO-like family protein [Halococcus dombrowskii]
MNVGIVGSGPAVESIEIALDDIETHRIDPDAIPETDLAVVVETAGATIFGEANELARESATPWLVVELGGVGGQATCEAAITGFGPETACYDCLRTRVAANADDTDEENDPSIDLATARLAGARAGYEISRLLAGDRSAAMGGVVELPHAERRLLPVPDCDCAGDRDRELRRGHEDRGLDDALGRAEAALDERVGIVTEVGEIASFPAPYYLARVGDTSEFSDASAASEAAGVAADWDRAFMKALGEALERYSAGVYRTGAFEHGASTEVEGAVTPSSFVLPESAETDAGASIPWVPGEDLATDESLRLPAEFVQFPPPEHRHGPSITTGLGLGNSGTEALLSGLTEVVERDAAMVSWYSTYDPLGLAVDDEGFETLARRARTEGLTVTPVLLTQDVDVPVVAVAVERDEWPRLAVGSAAGFDPDEAARSALAEALQSWMELRAMGPDEAAEAEGEIGQYADTPGAAAEFFAVGSRVPAASVGPETVPTGQDALDTLVDCVTEAGLDVYGARLTPRDVGSLGFEAVRVLVPDAQPLFTDEAFFGERASEVPDALGFEPRLDRAFHPYP